MGNASALARHWAGGAGEELFHDPRPALRYLGNQGIDHGYASYFDCYAINYLSNERFLCAQPYNERFFGWPLPYKEEVDGAQRAAYVLGPGIRFQWAHFEEDMRRRGVTCDLAIQGVFRVYTDFEYESPYRDAPVPAEELSVSVPVTPKKAPFLLDGTPETRWQSHHPQEAGMAVTLELERPRRLSRLRMDYTGYAHDMANALDILARTDQGWVPVREAVEPHHLPFLWNGRFPVYGSQVQEIPLRGTTTDALRIVNTAPRQGRDWTIGELQLFSTDPDLAARP